MDKLFISYAHVDNLVLHGADQGWVSCFAKNLEALLCSLYGRKEHFHLWMDRELRGNQPLTPDIETQLAQADFFILFLSPGYLASEWCQFELNSFCQRYTPGSKRIFVIELGRLEERPDVLEDLLGYPFWYLSDKEQLRQLAVPVPSTRSDRELGYYNTLRDVASDIVKISKQSETTSGDVAATLLAQPNNTFGTVYLAPTTEKLQEERQQMQRFLEQYDVTVLPANNQVNFVTYSNNLENDLGRCDYFIQLLDEDNFMGLSSFQFETASNKNISIFQWQDKLINVDEITDTDHRNLLEEKTVIVSNLSEFQQHLVKKILTPKPEEEVPKQTEFTNEKTIFINASPQDIELAEHIAEKLSDHNLSCILPLDHSGQATPKEIRQDLEQNIELCDSMLVLYHQCSPLTVREFIHTSLRIRTRTNQRPQNISICKAPESKPIRMWMKNVRTHECPQSFTDFCVQQALPELQQ